MQLMTWQIARLGSRFGLVFDPYGRRVMHSAMGRFLDEPLDLAVGLVEPDGVERVFPFTRDGELLKNCEMFERINSITYRGYSERWRLRLELNLHATFYPQHEPVSTMPVIFVEVRVNPTGRVRWYAAKGEPPDEVELFVRLGRQDTRIEPWVDGQSRPGLAMRYDAALTPALAEMHAVGDSVEVAAEADARAAGPKVTAEERLVSLNEGATSHALPDGAAEMRLTLPLTEEGSGTKWRMVWGAHVADRVLFFANGEGLHQDAPLTAKDATRGGRFRYARQWDSVEAVVTEAILVRDDALALSRRFEKLLEQAPIRGAQRHLLNQSFQAFLGNTWWVDRPIDEGRTRPWFSAWEGNCFFHATVDVEFNQSLMYLALWPELLAMQFGQWAAFATAHEPSGGAVISHDVGHGPYVFGQAYPHPMEVEENSSFLLMLQAYTRWTGDRSPARRHAALIQRLVDYLQWTDLGGTGYPTRGVANTIDDAYPATQYGRKQTYLGVKRAAALSAAADLIRLIDAEVSSAEIDALADDAIEQIERMSWLSDHYAVVADRSAVGITDPWTGDPLTVDELPGWDAYSIYTGHGLLLQQMVGRPALIDPARLRIDLRNAMRETASRYGCGHSSYEPENVWVSQNLWRDHLAGYLGVAVPQGQAEAYWDLQVMSNTFDQSYGYIDTYVNNMLSYYPRGVAAFGYLLAGPRLVIDRLAPGERSAYITVDPERGASARWPLLPLADWRAGKVPVCVVDAAGRVSIEGAIDAVIVHGEGEPATSAGLIG
ncbi:MAG: DUF4965 domain-containing protein [Planctomycetota bacterium]